MLNRHQDKIDSILSDLESEKPYYELCNVELTEEDALRVEELSQDMFYDDAISKVLTEIRQTLDNGPEGY